MCVKDPVGVTVEPSDRADVLERKMAAAGPEALICSSDANGWSDAL